MNENWDDYRVFIALAEAGSLLQAGKVLNTTHTTVLRRVNALEGRLKARLFERLKTGYVMTAAGEQMYENLQSTRDAIYQAERTVLGQDVQLSGTIKISTTDTIGLYWLPPYIAAFKEDYPDIQLDIDIRTGATNMSKREADVLIPATNRQPDTLVGRELQPITFRLYAHKDYVQQKKLPTILDKNSLSDLDFLLPNDGLARASITQYIHKHIEKQNIAASCDKLTGLYALCCQGLGVAPLPSYIGDKDAHLEVVMELPGEVQKNAIWILTHPDLRNTARIKTFMKFMRQNVVL